MKTGHKNCSCWGCYYERFLERSSDDTIQDWFYDQEAEDCIAHKHMEQCRLTYEGCVRLVQMPKAEQYLMDKSLIVEGRCLARRTLEPPAHLNVWAPKAYIEGVCGKARHGHTALCATHERIYEKAVASNDYSMWNGYITEELPEWSHIYGSKWSDKCKLKK
jgi:hypothetical protein